MTAVITAQNLSKAYSARPLFSDISFTLDERERVGIIGPNGSGKSTLLKIIAGMVEPDAGTITTRKFLKVAYVAQDNDYPAGSTVRQIVSNSLQDSHIEEPERKNKVEVILTRMGFADHDIEVATLSGGWKKRLALAAELVKEPDFLLLDEPTNHLDLEGVVWLEEVLRSAPFTFVLVSHDRVFLENMVDRVIELNPVYKDGYLSVRGGYSDFLSARQEYLVAQSNEQQALASKVRREIAWLQRGARARQTKAQGRIREAEKLIDDLAAVKSRNSLNTAAEIEFTASGRRTKELVVCKGISKSLGGKKLFGDLEIILSPGYKLGLLGTNGSGKTTLMRILAGHLEPDTGTIKSADGLRIVWFDQNRAQLDKTISLKEALCPSGDSVVYRDRSLHVATWAKRFLFRQDQLNMPVSYLSGGEQARLLIAQLMLQPADILFLDEPTNDLDIPSLEVLEESLEDFPGAVVLVTHDRFMLDSISSQLLALNGRGAAEFFEDYAQWESNRLEDNSPAKDNKASSKTEVKPVKQRQLSTSEKKELAEIEQRIEAAENVVAEIKKRMEDPKIAVDHGRLQACMRELEEAEEAVNKIYARWEDLESRASKA